MTSHLRVGALTSLPGRSESLVALVNGLLGDTLEDRDSRWSTPMTVRAGGTVLPLDRRSPRDPLSDVDVGPTRCVLVHGLMSTESIRHHGADPATTDGTLLADDHDITALSAMRPEDGTTSLATCASASTMGHS